LVEELVSAVRQALANVVEHAQATRVAVFADSEEGWVHVSVRDDGRGFVYDEKQLQAAGKAGMLRSMKGRVEDLGGKMRVETAPGAGTEVQFRIPAKLEEVTT
jgi:signal transduction histidine kinase